MTRPYPKPTKAQKGKKRKTSASKRKVLERELESLARELVNWRDSECIEKAMDGGRCSGVLQWGHFVPRQTSPFMVYVIGNTFKQCAGHNFLHHHKDPTFHRWYVNRFGGAAFDAICAEAHLRVGQKQELWELEEMIARYQYLLDDRPALYSFSDLVELGYYGTFPKIERMK